MKKQQIMIIEDEKNLAFFMKRVLTKRGYDVCSFESEEKALEYFYHNSISLIILDFHLSKMSGEEVVAKIKNKSVLMPIIITSGCFSEQIRQVQLSYSLKFLAKPFSITEFITLIEEEL